MLLVHLKTSPCEGGVNRCVHHYAQVVSPNFKSSYHNLPFPFSFWKNCAISLQPLGSLEKFVSTFKINFLIPILKFHLQISTFLHNFININVKFSSHDMHKLILIYKVDKIHLTHNLILLCANIYSFFNFNSFIVYFKCRSPLFSNHR